MQLIKGNSNTNRAKLTKIKLTINAKNIIKEYWFHRLYFQWYMFVGIVKI